VETRQSISPGGAAWWEQPWALILLVLAAAVPLLWPDVPPLVDLPGHMGRYRVQLDLAESEALQRFYSFEWALIGNLGVDLLVVPLSRLLGLELAVKLIILTVPPLTAAGFLWVAWEVHGRVPPTALFALPFAYNFPLLFGFANFALSMALAFLAFGLWLRLGRQRRYMLRAVVFVPISAIIWVTHAFGWGTLGVLAFSAELIRQHDQGKGYVGAAFHAGLHCLALAPPIALMLAWREDASGVTGDWFNWRRKFEWLVMALRDRWKWFDIASLILVVLLLLRAIRSPRIAFSRNLAASVLFLLAVFLLLPRIVFGSAYADMRLAPYLFAVAVIAIRMTEGADNRFMRTVAFVGLAFFAIRIGGTAASIYLYDRSYDRELAALEHVPHGARMVSFVGRECPQDWAMSRLDHLPALAIVRRHAFSNDQWTMDGAQLLDVRYPEGKPFTRDPSQIVTFRRCGGERWFPIGIALQHFNRAAFDYVWLINPPPYDPALEEGLRPIWRSGNSALFEVTR
jgi:hypothetical protein